MKKNNNLCRFSAIFMVTILTSAILTSCGGTFWDGMAQMYGNGGYGMGGYQVMPGGFVRDTRYDYLLDPRLAVQQVLNQEQQEYQAAKRYRPNLTLEQFRIEKGQALQMMKNSSGNSSSSSSSTSSSSSGSQSKSNSRDCRLCLGSGKCQTCNGKGYYYNPLDLTKTVSCPNCASNHNGKCSSCNGSGKK